MDPLFRQVLTTVHSYYLRYNRRPTAEQIQQELEATALAEWHSHQELLALANPYDPNYVAPSTPETALIKVPDSLANQIVTRTPPSNVTKIPPGAVAEIMKSEDFARLIALKGVPWKTYNGLTAEQHYTLLIVTDPTNRHPLALRLKAAGVEFTTYRTWLKDPEFAQALEQLSETMLKEMTSSVHNALIRSAEKGDTSAIKLYYEITGRYDPHKQQAMDVMSVLAQVVEIIQRRVTDPDTLTALAGDLRLLASVAVPGGSAIQATTVNGEVING
jgi:hypothetical protein